MFNSINNMDNVNKNVINNYYIIYIAIFTLFINFQKCSTTYIESKNTNGSYKQLNHISTNINNIINQECKIENCIECYNEFYCKKCTNLNYFVGINGQCIYFCTLMNCKIDNNINTTDDFKNKGFEVLCLVEWKTRNNKSRLKDSYVSNKILRDKFPKLLFKFYEDRIYLT